MTRCNPISGIIVTGQEKKENRRKSQRKVLTHGSEKGYTAEGQVIPSTQINVENVFAMTAIYPIPSPYSLRDYQAPRG